jgi:Protein of unknown function (DUF1566)
MKRIFGAMVALAVLALFTMLAEAAITIEVAEVQNSFAFVKGKAEKSAPITWDGNAVATSNKNNGGFSFNGAVPDDCIGELSDGVSTISVQVLNCTPVSQGGVYLKTGQTTSYATGDDGDYQAGATVPNPRFTDNGDGTVTDNLTGLTWPRDLDCVGEPTGLTWADAVAAANALADGHVACGLTDGSVAGDWRLPNRNELTSLLDLGRSEPALSAGHPFINFVTNGGYWSSTTYAVDTSHAWTLINFRFGDVNNHAKTSIGLVTAVRGGL